MASEERCISGSDTLADCAVIVTTSIAQVSSNFSRHGNGPVDPWTVISTVMYALIFVFGLLGNGLVIYAILRYAKMKTVTNMYILNLAIADLCFIFGLPFLIATAILRNWVFGFSMCKIFYILTSINWFTSVFTLTVMSADRYTAVCHPIRSIRYRTPLVSRVVCVCVWSTSLLVMLPIVLYATTLEDPDGRVSCTISWPEGQAITPDRAFIWYALLLGFAIPVALIVVFYSLVLLKLKTVGPKTKSKEKKRSHRKVTKMVLTVIAVYVVCWLPYWVFQVALTFATREMPFWCIQLFQIITVMSYTNSMLNPLLYAFLSDNFRKSFIKAFECASISEVNAALHAEHSVFPGRRSNAGISAPGGGQVDGADAGAGAGGGDFAARAAHKKGQENISSGGKQNSNEEIEFATTNITTSTKYETSCLTEESKIMVVNYDGVEAETVISTEPVLNSL